MNSIEPIHEFTGKVFDIIRGRLLPQDYYMVIYLYMLKNCGHLERLVDPDLRFEDRMLDAFMDREGIRMQQDEEYDHELWEYVLTSTDQLLSKLGYFDRNLVLDTAQKSDLFAGSLVDGFEFLLAKVKSAQGRAGAESGQPVELTQLMIGLLDPKQGTVYNPFAGMASFGMNLPDGVAYVGQELNRDIWAIGKLRAVAHELVYGFDLICGDSIREWIPDSEEIKPAYVISNPALGVKINRELARQIGTAQSDSEAFLIEKTLQSLRGSGKAVLLCTQGFLSKSRSKLRETLVKTDLVQFVISLPRSILRYSNVSVGIIVLNGERKDKDRITFIEATESTQKSAGRDINLDVERIWEILRTEGENEYKAIVSRDEVAANDYILSVKRYTGLTKIAYDESKRVYLKDLLKSVSPSIVRGVNGKLVKQKDLMPFQIVAGLNEDPFTDVPVQNLNGKYTKLDPGMLLVRLQGGALAPMLYRYVDFNNIGQAEGVYAYVGRDISVFEIVDKNVDEEFLLYQLHSDDVASQVERFSSSTTIPILSKSDFLRISIELPMRGHPISIEYQKVAVDNAKQSYFSSLQRERALEHKITEIRESSFRDMAAMRHSLRQYLNALGSNAAGTLKFLENRKDQPIWIDSLYSKNLNQTFGDHLKGMSETIRSMSLLLEDLDEKVTGARSQINDIRKLIKQAMTRFERKEVFTFESLYFDKESFASEKGVIAPVVRVWDEDFYVLFGNVIQNAVDHGFKEGKRYAIRTELTCRDGFCVLSIANNGIIPDPDFTFDRLKIRGEKTFDSSGSGIGGSDINNIVQLYSGTWQWFVKPDAEFPVVYEFSFALEHIE